jgi:hypothetical protein
LNHLTVPVDIVSLQIPATRDVRAELLFQIGSVEAAKPRLGTRQSRIRKAPIAIILAEWRKIPGKSRK